MGQNVVKKAIKIQYQKYQTDQGCRVTTCTTEVATVVYQARNPQAAQLSGFPVVIRDNFCSDFQKEMVRYFWVLSYYFIDVENRLNTRINFPLFSNVNNKKIYNRYCKQLHWPFSGWLLWLDIFLISLCYWTILSSLAFDEY